MKIPLEITNERVILHTFIRGKRIAGRIKFFVDTGSPISFISEADTKRLGISLQREFDDRANIGATKILFAEIKDLEFLTKNDESRLEIIKLSSFRISKSVSKRDSSQPPSFSIIGLDFLRDNEFTLFVDPSKNIACLEKVNNVSP